MLFCHARGGRSPGGKHCDAFVFVKGLAERLRQCPHLSVEFTGLYRLVEVHSDQADRQDLSARKAEGAQTVPPACPESERLAPSFPRLPRSTE